MDLLPYSSPSLQRARSTRSQTGLLVYSILALSIAAIWTVGASGSLVAGADSASLALLSVIVSVPLAGLIRVPITSVATSDYGRARQALARYDADGADAQGIANSIWAYAAESDKSVFVSADGAGFVSYRRCGGVALAAGDPVCAPERRVAVAGEFAQFCRDRGMIPAFYQVLHTDVDTYQSSGFRAVKIGEEATIDVRRFTLAGKKIANVRHCVTHAEREGLAAEAYLDGVHDPEIFEELETVSNAWLGSRAGRGEMGFSMGGFGRNEMASACVVLARDSANKVRAFVTFRRVAGGREVVLDLMRREPDAPSGTIDFLIARALMYFQEAGIDRASLSLAPLAKVRGDGRLPLMERMLDLLYDKGNNVYRYRSLFNFKRKFAPTWEPRYLVYPAGAINLLQVLMAITIVHLPKGAFHLPAPSACVRFLHNQLRQCLDWRHGLLPEELVRNVRLMSIITTILSIPELRGSLSMLLAQPNARSFAVLGVSLAVVELVGAVLLGARKIGGRILLQVGAAGFILKCAWAFAAGYDGGLVSWTMALILAPIEVWVLWFLAQPDVKAWERGRLPTETPAAGSIQARAA
ncbi:MAG: hypothetical protein JWO59_785 [Chloroflexi bacterium]|nr:hypothetical protein [Chloroflexota bacterium]